MIGVVRHGEREDDLPRNRKTMSEVYFDPALSSVGENQSQATGKYIAEYLRRRGLDESFCRIRIISSPFLRTLQTASIIADELKCKKVEIWDPLCEELKEDLFKSFPIPHLNFYIHDTKILHEKFLKNKITKFVKIDDPEEILKPINFPEKERKNHFISSSSRAKLALEYLLHNSFSTDDDTSNLVPTQVVILVTHAFYLEPFVQFFSPEVTHCKDRNYCSIAFAKRCNNSWKLIENCSSDHLLH